MALEPATTNLTTTIVTARMATTAPLDRNPAAVYLATLRPTSRRPMHQVLNAMAGWLSDCELQNYRRDFSSK